MERIYLSETEKALLLSLNAGIGFDLIGIGDKELGEAATTLRNKSLIKAMVTYDMIIDAAVLAKGEDYIKGNPMLENPVSDNELKHLQKNELEYELKIRKQEDVIRLWRLITAIAGIVGLAGWLFAFLLK
ncbi:MAG TPA: hypothetical protein VFC67_26665 [Prolixibacteraceae bacterium]|nr:hypothetical protein [Prolixibacteraceae bacterium]